MSATTGPRYEFHQPCLSVRSWDTAGRHVAPFVRGSESLAGRRIDHLMILIHGFNNTQGVADSSFDKFCSLLQSRFRMHRFNVDAVAQFHWPGNPMVNLGLKLLSPNKHYPHALRNAKLAALRLREFLLGLRPERRRSSLQVTLVGHSMGCRLIVEMLRQMPTADSPDFRGIGLLAAAVPVELVSSGGSLSVRSRINTRLLKFHSPSDRILRFLFPIGQWWSFRKEIDEQRVEQARYREAVGLLGNPMGFADNWPRRNNGHSDYWGDSKVVDKILNKIEPTFPLRLEPWESEQYATEAHTIEAYELAQRRLLT